MPTTDTTGSAASEQAREVTVNTESHIEFQLIPIDKTLPVGQLLDQNFTPLVERVGGTLEFSYSLNEGQPFNGSYGTYFVGSTKDGNVLWVVNALVDVIRPGIIQAAAVVSPSDWQAAVAEANEARMEYPSARTFVPKIYSQIR